MADLDDKTIPELTAIDTPATGDMLVVTDVSDTTDSAAGSSKRSTLQQIADWLASLTQTLTNKTLTTPTLNTPTLNTPKINEDVAVTASATEINQLDGNTLSGDNTGDETSTTIGAMMAAADAKTTPVDADTVPLTDSEASSVLKKLSWANIKATLKTYFDSLTTTLTNKTLTSPVINNGVMTAPTFFGTLNGWISANDTWTYASATTITVPAGAGSKYAVGDKIKLVQTTTKYFYIVTVADTLLTVRGGSEYSVANAAITSNYYSHEASPVGFIDFFVVTDPAFTAAGTAFSSQPSTISFYFKIVGKLCHLVGLIQTAGSGTGTGVWTVTFTADELPAIVTGGGGTCGPFNGQNGFVGLQEGVPGVIKLYKYDGTAIAGNGAYITISASWRISA